MPYNERKAYFQHYYRTHRKEQILRTLRARKRKKALKEAKEKAERDPILLEILQGRLKSEG